MPMKLVETHIVKKTHPAYEFFDEKTKLSKNLYNAAMRYIAEIYESTKTYANYYDVNRAFVECNKEEYRALSANVSQQVLMQVDHAWKAYFAALREYKKNPSKFKAMPNPPKTKDQEWQRNALTYTQRVISAASLRNGMVVLNSEDSFLRTRLELVQQVKVTRMRTGQFKVNLVYNRNPAEKTKSGVYAGCDMGVNNLVTIGFNDKTSKAVMISGGPLKSINQYYHKRMSELKSKLGKNRKSSKRTRKLGAKRDNKVSDYVHKASRKVVDALNENNVSKIVIGYNPEWKQNVALGKRNNQNFVSIPFLKMINAVSYKLSLIHI